MPLNPVRATEPLWKHPAESKTFTLDFSSLLDGRTISSISAITTASGLTVGASTVAGPYVEKGSRRRVDGGKAIDYVLQGGVDDTNYDVTVVVTDGNSDIHAGVQEIRVRAT